MKFSAVQGKIKAISMPSPRSGEAIGAYPHRYVSGWAEKPKAAMDQGDDLSRLIGRIYDAALDPTLWSDVLTGIAEFVGGRSRGILPSSLHCLGADSRAQNHAQSRSHADLPSKLPLSDIYEMTGSADLIPDDESQDGHLGRRSAEPEIFADAANGVLEESLKRYARLHIIRNEIEGAGDQEMRRRLDLIAPHVRRAVLIGKMVDIRKAETAALADVTDGLGAGVFLLDVDARIVHANAAGHAFLRAGDFLRTIGGRLIIADAPTDQTLREIVAHAGTGVDALGVKGIAVPLPAADGGRFVAHVLPLTTGRRRGTAANYDAIAALFVRKATLDMPSPSGVIATTYKLTPTELRVLLAIVEIGGVPEVAAALGIAETTVKTHLGRLFDKTGTRRQADLVKLVAGFSSPLAN
jgi:DNA-binding CsgD family transcriptional regulator